MFSDIQEVTDGRGKSRFYLLQGGKKVPVPVKKGAAGAVKRGNWIMTETTDAIGKSKFRVEAA